MKRLSLLFVVCLLAVNLIGQRQARVQRLEERLSSADTYEERYGLLSELIEATAGLDADLYLDYIERAATLAERQNDVVGQVRALHRWIEWANFAADYDAMRQYIERAIQLGGGSSEVPPLLHLRSQEYATLSPSLAPADFPKPDSVIRAYYARSQRLGDPYHRGVANVAMSRLTNVQQIDSSVQFTLVAKAAFQEAGQDFLALRVTETIAALYQWIGQDEQALTYLEAAYAAADTLDHLLAKGFILRRLAKTYYDRGTHASAAENFRRAQRFFEQANYPVLARSCTFWIGRSLLDQGRYEEALRPLRTEVERRLPDSVGTTSLEALLPLGRCYLGLDRLSLARDQVAEAKRLLPGQAQTYSTQTFTLEGDIAMAADRPLAAIDHYRQAIFEARSESELRRLIEVRDKLAVAYRQIGQPGRSAEQLQAGIALRDTLANLSKTNATARLATALDLSVTLDQLKIMEQTNEIAELSLFRQRQKITLLAIGLGLAALIAILLYRQYRFKTTTNRELSQLLSDKELLMAEINHRARNNLAVAESLIEVQSWEEAEGGTQEALSKVRNRLAAIQLIHDQLYVEGHHDIIRLDAYLEALGANLRTGLLPSTVHLHLDVERTDVCVDDAVPIGLIVNEAVTNAVKHAFPRGGAGNVFLTCEPADEEGYLSLRIKDDGRGWLDTTAKQPALTLIRGLSRQMHGNVLLTDDSGTLLTMTLRLTRSASLQMDD